MGLDRDELRVRCNYFSHFSKKDETDTYTLHDKQERKASGEEDRKTPNEIRRAL